MIPSKPTTTPLPPKAGASTEYLVVGMSPIDDSVKSFNMVAKTNRHTLEILSQAGRHWQFSDTRFLVAVKVIDGKAVVAIDKTQMLKEIRTVMPDVAKRLESMAKVASAA